MDIDVDLNKLVPENKMELGGKRNKSKTKKNKTSGVLKRADSLQLFLLQN